MWIRGGKGPRYAAARVRRLFAVCHQTPGTAILGRTAFSDTQPLFIVRQAAASRRTLLLDFSLTQSNVAGGPIYVQVATDTTDRLDGANPGTAIAYKGEFTDVANPAPQSSFHYHSGGAPLAATAPSANVAYLDIGGSPAVQGVTVEWDSTYSLAIGATGSVLVYAWAAVTAPQFYVSAELLEEPLIS